MQHQGTLAVSGHVFRVERKRGPHWYIKYRIGPKQIQKRLGPAWLDKGEPPSGYHTRKTAEAALAALLTDARRGIALPHSTGSGATVREAAEEWLRHSEWERGAKPSTPFRKRSGSPSPSFVTGNFATRKRPTSDVGTNLDDKEERASLVAFGKYAVDRKESFEVRREVAPDPERKVSAFSGWQAYGVPRVIPHLQMNREASKMARPATSVAHGEGRSSAENINRGSDLLGRAGRQRSSRILRRNAELPGPRLGSGA
jgi:hypothetical protein